MEINRLTITTESRILGDKYVRFGGEYIETCFHKGKQGALCLAIAGYTRIRGGWNNGKAYTVYFYAETDRPFVQSLLGKGNRITKAQSQYDSAEKTGALLRFAKNDKVVQLKVGISFLSMQKAKFNASFRNSSLVI